MRLGEEPKKGNQRLKMHDEDILVEIRLKLEA